MCILQEIACYMGIDLGQIHIKRFADGEIYVQLQESVRGCDVFLVQPTCPPANENLMELLIMIDACRRASAKNITAVIPYFGYARADRKTQGRESIAAKLVANLITEAGAHRVLICDLHSGQSMGYFDIPVDHVYGQVCGKPLAQLSALFGVSCIMSTWMLYSKRCSIAICSNNTVISI
jgi:ribose-phosphate pyrophosphokinase